MQGEMVDQAAHRAQVLGVNARSQGLCFRRLLGLLDRPRFALPGAPRAVGQPGVVLKGHFIAAAMASVRNVTRRVLFGAKRADFPPAAPGLGPARLLLLPRRRTPPAQRHSIVASRRTRGHATHATHVASVRRPCGVHVCAGIPFPRTPPECRDSSPHCSAASAASAVSASAHQHRHERCRGRVRMHVCAQAESQAAPLGS